MLSNLTKSSLSWLSILSLPGIDISRCEVEGEYYCACEKYFEGISGQGCSEGRHNCDHSKTCYMNHPWHACCLNKAAEAEDEVVEAKEHEPQKEENSGKRIKLWFLPFFVAIAKLIIRIRLK